MKVANQRARTPKIVAYSTPYGKIRDVRSRYKNPLEAAIEQSPYDLPYSEISNRGDIEREFLFTRSLSTGLLTSASEPKLFCSWDCCRGYVKRYAYSFEHRQYLDMIIDIAAAGTTDK
jgi:hypothetical protein